MILRIRPSRLSAPKVKVVLPASRADVVLALLFSMISVTLAVAFFTLFCWKVAAVVGEVRAFPFTQGFLGQRSSWLFLAGLAWLFAKLMDTLAELLKSRSQKADELATERVPELATAPESLL